MQQDVTEIGTAARHGVAKLEEGEVESKPLINSPEVQALVVKEFRKIEKTEEEIAEKRQDIKEAVKRMVGKGLNRKAVKMALARRKLVVKGGLEQVDESLNLICGIGILGIQGELFSNEGNGQEPPN